MVLPLPPALNSLYHTTRFGGFYKSTEGKKYAQHVAALLHGAKPLDGDITLSLAFYFPRAGNDIDSRLKVGLDSLEGYIYRRDSQIAKLIVTKAVDKKNPRMEILTACVFSN